MDNSQIKNFTDEDIVKWYEREDNLGRYTSTPDGDIFYSDVYVHWLEKKLKAMLWFGEWVRYHLGIE